MTEKTIEAYLIVDWRKGNVRARKTEPALSDLGTNELKADVEIDVHVPDVDVPTLSLEIDVPEPRIYAATIEALDDEDLPEWAELAIEKVEMNSGRFLDADENHEWAEAVDVTAMQVMTEAPGRPDPERVREFVSATGHDIIAEDKEATQS